LWWEKNPKYNSNLKHERSVVELLGHQKKGVSSFLKDLILEHNFHFIGLQETMTKNLDDKTLRKIDPNGTYLWKWTLARGKSGGLLSGIHIDFMEVGSFTEGKYILQMDLWDK